MELQPSTAPLPSFWQTVRRRHPDVDLVLLPGEARADGAGETDRPLVTSEQVEAVSSRMAVQLGELVGAPAESRVGFGPDPGTVVVRARTTSPAADADGAVGSLGRRLAAAGWQVRRFADPAVPRLLARTDDLHLRATAVRETLLVEVTGSPLLVGDDEARRMAGG